MHAFGWYQMNLDWPFHTTTQNMQIIRSPTEK